MTQPEPTPTLRTRQSADERREAILEAARAEFAAGGLHGTNTETIARRAGVSQPYVFRLFGTKKNLYLACVERGFQRVIETFRRAAEGSAEPFHAMGMAYIDLLGDRDLLLAQLHAYADCSDSDVQELVRQQFGALFRWLMTQPGATEEEVRNFLSVGMLLNVVAAIDDPSILGTSDWTTKHRH